MLKYIYTFLWGVSMKIKKGYKLKQIGGQYTVVVDRRIVKSFNSLITLNQSAVFLWNLLKERNVTKQEMLDALLSEFEISTVLALSDIDVFVKTMKKNEIIEE